MTILIGSAVTLFMDTGGEGGRDGVDADIVNLPIGAPFLSEHSTTFNPRNSITGWL